MLLKPNLILVLCLTAAALVTTNAVTERARYDHYRVYKVTPSDAKELDFLKQVQKSSDSLLFLEGIHLENKPIEVVVAPHKLPDFLRVLENNAIDFELLTENLQEEFDEERAANDKQIQGRDLRYGWEAYNKLDETYNWLVGLMGKYPGLVTLIEGGKTYEKRSILGVKISYDNGNKSKPGVFWEGGIHAREWISPAVTTYFINQLLTSEEPAVKDLAQNYDWYIFPHANPDGYVYTHTTDRMWRKTRHPYGICYGADPNRNWDFQWNTVGASDNSCDDTYAGPKAFSELETRSLSNYIKALKGKIQLYLSFHSYSQYILYPYGHTPDLPDNIADFRRVFDVGVAAFAQRYGTKYTGGNTYDAIYPASGSSVDWAYGLNITRMSFCVELRPSANSFLTGFKLPADKIIPTSEETLDAVVAMVNEVKRLGYFKSN